MTTFLIWRTIMKYTLSDLRQGEQGSVQQISQNCPIRTRFLRLGLIPGEPIACVAVAPGGDPKAFLIKGAVIAIRNEDSAAVAVTKEEI